MARAERAALGLRWHNIATGLAVLTFVLGCSGQQYIPWTKPQTTRPQLEADYNECQQEVKRDTQTEYAVDTDITATHRQDWENAGVFNQKEAELTSGAADLSQQMLASCMARLGYRPAT